MTDVFRFCGAMIISLFMFILLESSGTPISKIIPICAVTVTFLFILNFSYEFIDFMNGARKYIGNEITKTLIKICAVAFITEFTSLVCDGISATISKCVQTFGKISIVVLVFPIFKNLVETSLSILP